MNLHKDGPVIVRCRDVSLLYSRREDTPGRDVSDGDGADDRAEGLVRGPSWADDGLVGEDGTDASKMREVCPQSLDSWGEEV